MQESIVVENRGSQPPRQYDPIPSAIRRDSDEGYTTHAVFYNQHNGDNGMIREQQGKSEGHFCVSLHLGASADTSVVSTEVASTTEESHRTMIYRTDCHSTTAIG